MLLHVLDILCNANIVFIYNLCKYLGLKQYIGHVDFVLFVSAASMHT